jgi:hypothetical protein
MANPTFIQKTLKMKPEVTKIFDDLDAWLNYCRLNLINFDRAELYRSNTYRTFIKEKEYFERKARRDAKALREAAIK